MCKKYKVCIITTISSTIKAFFLNQIQYLSNNGFEVTVICSPDNELNEILSGYANFIPVPMKRGVDFLGSISAIIKLSCIFKKEKFDIIQYSTPNAAFYSSVASSFTACKIRLYHNMGYRYVTFNGLKRILFKEIEKITCKLSTHIQPVSLSNLEFGVSQKLFNKNKASVIWNGSTGGVDLEKFDINKRNKWKKEICNIYNIDKNQYVFGFLGRITKDKGIDEIIGAYKKLTINNNNNNNNILLMLVGSEENTTSLNQELYSWAKKRNDIIFVGETKEPYKYLATFDVLLLPSYREGFGNVVIESQAMGTPVIVSDIPGPTEAMINNLTGYIVPVRSTEKLSKMMLKSMNKDSQIEMSKNSIEFIKNNFDSKKLMKKILEDKYRLLIEGERRK